MPAYTRVTRHGQITLPAPVRRRLNIEEGDIVEIEVVNERATIVPKRLIDKAQSYFWTKEWQEAEKEAADDIRAGRVKTFESVDKLVDDLG